MQSAVSISTHKVVKTPKSSKSLPKKKKSPKKTVPLLNKEAMEKALESINAESNRIE